MNIAIVGITGNVGSRIAAEALSRGHRVTGVARAPEKAAPRADLTVKAGDLAAPEALAEVLRGHDAVVSAARFVGADPRAVLKAVRLSGTPRLAVVGGAGSLEVAPGLALVDTPKFPEAYKPEALAGRDFLTVLRGEKDIDWTFLSPAAILAPGKRTGKFRLGGDALLVDEKGDSRVSIEDFAVALVDELETPRHSRKRFSVAY
jgi:putative NADH-flavin reductase